MKLGMSTPLEDDIYNIIDNSDSQDLSDWNIFEEYIKKANEFDRFIGELRREFMRGVPEYFPE